MEHRLFFLHAPQTEEGTEVSNISNPFNPGAEIRCQVPEVRLIVYDLLGQRVEVLVDAFVEAGTRSIVWDAKNVASDNYLVRMAAKDFAGVRKRTLIR